METRSLILFVGRVSVPRRQMIPCYDSLLWPGLDGLDGHDCLPVVPAAQFTCVRTWHTQRRICCSVASSLPLP